jgi:hypothetical protein
VVEGAVDIAGGTDGCLGCAHGLHCLPVLLLVVGAPALLIWMM